MEAATVILLLGSLVSAETPDTVAASAPCVSEETFFVPFMTCDGEPQRIFVRYIACPAESRPPIVILHFASGHSGRMLPLARNLASAGYPAYAIDLLGHGNSSIGEPVYDDMIVGLQTLAQLLCERHHAPSIGLVGSSMGGEIAVMYAAKQSANKAAGASLLVGSVVAQGLYTPWQRDVAWRFTMPTLFLLLTDPVPPILVSPPVVLSNWMFPPRRIYQDSELRGDFRRDPLRKRAFPGKVIVKATRYRLDLPDEPIATPLLVLHGTKDEVVRQRYAERVFEGLGRYFAMAEYVELNGASHAIFEEETAIATTLIDDWLLRTLP